MIKAAVFDFDGTIANTMPFYMRIFRQVLGKYMDHKPTDVEIASTFGLDEEGMLRVLIPAQYKTAITELYDMYDRGIQTENLKPIEGIPQLLDFLREKGIKTALVTGKSAHTCAVSLKYLGMDASFSDVISGNPDRPAKADALKELLARYSLAPEELVYIGDALTDVTEAKDAGVACLSAAWCSFTDREGLEKVNGGRVFHTVASLQDFFAGQ